MPHMSMLNYVEYLIHIIQVEQLPVQPPVGA